MTLKHFNNLAYEDIGEENSKTILFLHPKLLDKWIWRKQKEDYDKYFKGFHCIFLDLPNHGDSISKEEFSIYKSSIEISEFINHIINNIYSSTYNPYIYLNIFKASAELEGKKLY